MPKPILISRRDAIRGAAAAAALLACPAIAKARPKVVVLGGGAGGATAAKYLRHGDDAVEVTLVEANRSYVTPFTSNLYLGGLKPFETLSYGYEGIAARGVGMVFDSVTAIDRDARQVLTASGARLSYDRLVLSPGIDFRWDAVPGYSETAAETMPHGYRGGAQFKLLKSKLDALGDGALIVIIAPPNPYRCPPAPYERASMMAYALKTRGVKDARIVILDAKDHFAMQTLFIDGWERHYPGMIEWQDPTIHGGIKAVDPKAMTVTTDFETHKAALVNVIPPQIAGKLARDAGLADASGFCPVNAETMTSLLDPSIQVIGDSATGGEFPKSGFAANNEAKGAAMILRAELLGERRMPIRFTNHCWSDIAPDDAIKNGARYAPQNGRIVASDPYTSQLDESAELRAKQAREAAGWYIGMTTDIFG
ncbi:FAD/NAD(P)-binding oxidoreductase [Rhodopseudomonas palustris]|uniref:FAD/NAD(P)-binding oxidoreductase n=1 Tax=Rhodopseudomonas palustris TaxID=1076 RepID=UPI002ACDE718|nr:FAD/NAD(P)-binding oxidoreductase [Rhodopseudomonas palustris]WQG99292.1 FAD/NAD(P)-binding oxidoreductase [Rhodopseudomonas palustris]